MVKTKSLSLLINNQLLLKSLIEVKNQLGNFIENNKIFTNKVLWKDRENK